jgi:hypothetical protein
MIELKPALQSSQGRSRHWSGALLTNCFAEHAEGDKRSEFAVMATPGLTCGRPSGPGPIRGRLVVGGVLYVVSGAELYSVSAAGYGDAHRRIPGTGPVRMAANYTELAIAAGRHRLRLLRRHAAHAARHSRQRRALRRRLPYLGRRRIPSSSSSRRSTMRLTYDAADIASAEGFPDNIVGAINDHREIQFFGQNSTEIFYNSGAAAFPFERQGNAFIERGCLDRDSIVKIDNSVMFVGDDRIVYSLAGYLPQRISTHREEYLLRDATYARAFTYNAGGAQVLCPRMRSRDDGLRLRDPAVARPRVVGLDLVALQRRG